MTSISWHAHTIETTLEKLESRARGLTILEAEQRLKRYGLNALPEGSLPSVAVLFLRQFQSPLIYLLLAASAAVFLMGETVDGSIVLGILIFNAIVGAIQEGRAQNTLRALKRLTEGSATVIRDGIERILADTDVVPGDIIILQEGEKIPADARIILARGLKTDEASLTGESEPVEKIAEAVFEVDRPVADRTNMVFKGTHVAAGGGTAIVTETGIATIIGAIAQEVSSIDTETPLKADIRVLSRAIIVAVGIISIILFAAGLMSGNSVREMFAVVVSLAVSVIPEGLPIVMTLVLATGVWRMSKRNALVKKLQAVEALGQASIIAVDKTGTITRNELVIRTVWTSGKAFEMSGIGYDPHGDVLLDGHVVDAANHPELLFMGKLATFCANARLSYSDDEKRWQVSGDPTEAAMLVFGEKVGFRKEDLLAESPFESEIPFDYRLKYHATVHGSGKDSVLTVIGAPEAVIGLCTTIHRNGKDHPLVDEEREALEATVVELSQRGLRVLAVGTRRGSDADLSQGSMAQLSFVGFFGMKDALRSEVKDAMKRATGAGIRVVMITGDHRITARAIAEEAGIYHEGDGVLTGEDIDAMSDGALADRLGDVSVFARVTPEHKLRIINAYRARGEIIAMTGDGVNDAPSLVAADLGVAMGISGTEVAKEAADIVLLDDDFGSIVSAVEEGRGIYKTIKKVILYLFSTSAGEVLTIGGALFLGYPLPILPAQIIWLNFVTDGFLDVALAMEPKEKGLLSGGSDRPKRRLVDGSMARRMILMAIPMAIGALYLFTRYYETDIAKAWTMSLTVLAVFQWFNVWNCRSEGSSIFSMNPFSNRFLVGATAIVIGLQLLAVYNPLMQKILRTVPLSLSEWGIAITIAASIIAVEEIRKLFYRNALRRGVVQGV